MKCFQLCINEYKNIFQQFYTSADSLKLWIPNLGAFFLSDLKNVWPS